MWQNWWEWSSEAIKAVNQIGNLEGSGQDHTIHFQKWQWYVSGPSTGLYFPVQKYVSRSNLISEAREKVTKWAGNSTWQLSNDFLPSREKVEERMLWTPAT